MNINKAQDYVDCYMSGQISEAEWVKLCNNNPGLLITLYMPHAYAKSARDFKKAQIYIKFLKIRRYITKWIKS